MAVMMQTSLPGFTEEAFVAGFAPLLDQLKAFPGFIAQASGTTAGGYQVTEVWESQAAHERWLSEVIAPALAQAGVTAQPAVQYTPLARFFTK